MYRKKTNEEKDIERYVVSDQMIRRGILSQQEVIERKELMEDIADKYQEFLADEICSARRMSVSLGIVKRRNAMYRKLFEMILPVNADKFLERHIYYCIEHNEDPNPELLSIKLNYDEE